MEHPVVYWYLTYKCNLSCRHCAVESGSKTVEQPLNRRDEVRLLASIETAKPRVVCLSGGEPLLHASFLDLCIGLLSFQPKILVETNGTLISEDLLNRILDQCLPSHFEFLVSLDGNQESHDWLRGKGSFKATVRGLKLLKEAGFSFEVQCTLNRRNLSSIVPLAEFCLEQLNASLVKYVFTYRVGRAGTNWADFDMSSDEYLNCLESVYKAMLKFPQQISLKAAPATIPPAMYLKFIRIPGFRLGTGCSFPILGILPDGTVTLCSLTRQSGFQFGNALLDDMRTIWESDLVRKIRNEYETYCLSGVCSECVFREKCKGSCRALAYQAFGSLTAPFPVCEDLYRSGRFYPIYRRIVKNPEEVEPCPTR